MPPRVTIRHIAKMANVHHTTVSLALRNSPRLREETRRHIRKLADEMGYVPDAMLASLNAYRRTVQPAGYQATIAWINNWPRRREPYRYFADYFEGAKERAHSLGYALEEFWLREKGMTPRRLEQILKARNILGLLLLPQPEASTRIDLDFSGFSVVNFGYSFQPAVFHVVTNHHPQSFRLALSRLRDLGYRRIGFYEGSPDWDKRSNHAWLSSLLLEHWQHRRVKVLSPLLSRRGRYPGFIDWVEKEKPDAVLTYSAFADNLKKAGYRIPGDIGFASLHLPAMGSSLSGICQNDATIGKRAVDLLVGMLQRGERGVPETPLRLLVEGAWNPGQTLRPGAAATSAP
ncbi:MAG TPA: LacI family DNA-binding transcriptional regulator [Candidatus Methylacidiphilales bacterium]